MRWGKEGAHGHLLAAAVWTGAGWEVQAATEAFQVRQKREHGCHVRRPKMPW